MSPCRSAVLTQVYQRRRMPGGLFTRCAVRLPVRPAMQALARRPSRTFKIKIIMRARQPYCALCVARCVVFFHILVFHRRYRDALRTDRYVSAAAITAGTTPAPIKMASPGKRSHSIICTTFVRRNAGLRACQ